MAGRRLEGVVARLPMWRDGDFEGVALVEMFMATVFSINLDGYKDRNDESDR